jgi:ABC-type bacteriocin/lantibiotic exporter with double-glycine peptidase domain
MKNRNLETIKSNSQIIRCFSLLNRKDRKKLSLIVSVQIAMSLLDLIGIAVVGILGALAVTGVQSTNASSRVTSILEILHLDQLSFQMQTALLGVIAILLFIVRTIFSVLISRKILRFLSAKSARISSNAAEVFIKQPFDQINSESSQGVLYRLTIGIDAIFVFVIGTSLSLISDAALLMIMFFGMLIVDTTMALSSLIFFSLVGVILYKVLNKKAVTLGENYSRLQIESNEMLVEVLKSYREVLVRDRRNYYIDKFSKNRFEYANNSAELAFMPNVSKYVIEGSVLVGAFCITAIQFIIHDAPRAVAVLAVFLAAGTRIAPAVLRAQQGALLVKSTLGQTQPTLDMLSKLDVDSSYDDKRISKFESDHHDFRPEIDISNLSKKYQDTASAALEYFNLHIKPGEFVAIVGPSGSGKTTILDCLLGINAPTSGEIRISGCSPREALSKWPGAIGYVSQEVYISNKSIIENIALGFDPLEVPEKAIWSAINSAKLNDFVQSLPIGLNTILGENGAKISGGQKQRIGIARALLTSPKLLVLDEATSALDGITEAEISSEILSLKGDMSILVIAHRLSTILDADRIYYLDNGKLLGTGTFKELKATIPQFAAQAEIMGL